MEFLNEPFTAGGFLGVCACWIAIRWFVTVCVVVWRRYSRPENVATRVVLDALRRRRESGPHA